MTTIIYNAPQAILDQDVIAFTLPQRYPHGRLCPIAPANVALFQQAAADTGFRVEARVNKVDGKTYMYALGVLDRDPAPLFARFQLLQVQAVTAKRAAQGEMAADQPLKAKPIKI